jgi:hypothetical protein
MEVIKRESQLWQYMPDEIRGLIEDGEIILSFVYSHNQEDTISDYSFLVFPFAKAYEGFLKRFFLDMGLISKEEYFSDDIRIGRILNPNYIKEKNNVFERVCGKGIAGREVAKKLWQVWKRGRNLVFHYFPHNYRRLSYEEALDIINGIVDAMHNSVNNCKI